MTTKELQSIEGCLSLIGQDAATRERIIAALLEWESRHQRRHEGVDLRETATGPLVDALYKDIPLVSRKLSSGLMFSMPYKSRIAREFAMGVEPLDHVWEPQTTRLLLMLAGRARHVLVGGAYCGDHALPLASLVAERGGHVHCFELQALQLDALRKNASANGLSNITVNAVGLWSRPGFVQLQGSDSHATPQWCDSKTPDAFPVTTIDEYCRKSGVETLDLVMLDIEGGEFSALQGAEHFMASPVNSSPDLVFEIHRSYVDWSTGIKRTPIIGFLLDHGYDVFAVRDYQAHVDMSGLPVELVDLDDIYLEGPPHGFNMFATKRSSLVKDLGLVVRRGVSPKLLHHRFSERHQPGTAAS